MPERHFDALCAEWAAMAPVLAVNRLRERFRHLHSVAVSFGFAELARLTADLAEACEGALRHLGHHEVAAAPGPRPATGSGERRTLSPAAARDLILAELRTLQKVSVFLGYQELTVLITVAVHVAGEILRAGPSDVPGDAA